MFVSKWIVRSVLAGSVVLALAFAVVLRAQHDTNASNTHMFDLTPVDGKGGEDISGSYDVDAAWPKPLHPDWVMGRAAGVYAESADRVYVATTGEIPAHLYERAWGPQFIPKFVPAMGDLTRSIGRWEHVLLVYDRNGNLLESWDQWNARLGGPNRILTSPYDPEHHVWVIDQIKNEIFEFSHDGKTLALNITEKDVPKTDPKARFSVQEMAWMPNGDFYVVGNSRVMKFSKAGTFLSEFGKEGSGPGEFSGIHGIVIEPTSHRLFIADRTNSRIQVVDENGKYLDQWPHMPAPYCIRLSKDRQHLWVSDGYTQRFGRYDLNGKLDTSTTWGTFGVVPGAIWGPHYFDVDNEGNLYVAEDYNARVQKFRPRAGADPKKLVDVSR